METNEKEIKENIENITNLENIENIENIHMEKINESQMNFNYIFRICLLGDSNVGKTSLLTQFCDNNFKEKYNNTIGVDFRVVVLKYKNIISKVHIWDTAGQERFKSIAINYFRSTHGFIFVYDITDEESFHNLENWINLAKNNTNTAVINFLVGNKCDEEEKRKVEKKRGEDFAKKKDLIFLEASAKNSDNVQKLFEYFTFKLIEYYKNNNMDKYLGKEINENIEEIHSSELKRKKCNC